MVLVALAMVAIIAMAALSIDIITLYLAREQAQRSADEAALAAARVISLSGLTGDPNNSSSSWAPICGGPGSPASLAAIAVATQSEGGGTAASPPVVTYSAGGAASPDCTNVTTGAFGVNPLVTVRITRSSLPTFFSRIWGNTGNSVSATAMAEAFNPSASDLNTNGGATGTVIPVQPSCVKPLMVPNQNPNSLSCSGSGCPQFVTLADGSIVNPGILPATASGVVGEVFTLAANCKPGAGSCRLKDPQPMANGSVESPPNLEYIPGEAPPSSVAVPACATSGNGGKSQYESAVGGCDQSTVYQCGVQSSLSATPNLVDLGESPAWPAPGDTGDAVACLLTNSTTVPLVGQDVLDTSSYPYKITAGTANANVAIRGDIVTSSNSIMSLPIYDPGTTIIDNGGTTNVTIVGFLQVFINNVNFDGSLQVTVLNVAGCGNNASTSRAVTGTSPVPVRLITPP